MDSQDHESAVPDPIPTPETVTMPGLGMGPGVLLDKRYLIERELGRGGFGVVYLAHDTQLHGRNVVVKVLLDHQSDQWIEKKFLQECEALARVEHPGVVGVKDRGQTLNGKPYLVLEFVKGITLRSLLKPSGLDLDRAANLIRQIGQALSAAHDQGVFHRDLKPANVMVRDLGGGQEQAVIIDFGIATVLDSSGDDSYVTKIAGSPGYMAPEQMHGKPVAASDTYALGVMAYQMLTGKMPFTFEHPAELLFQQKEGPKRKPSDLRPDLSPAADRAILRAMAYEPADRFPRAEDFGCELERAIGRLRVAELQRARHGPRMHPRPPQPGQTQQEL